MFRSTYFIEVYPGRHLLWWQGSTGVFTERGLFSFYKLFFANRSAVNCMSESVLVHVCGDRSPAQPPNIQRRREVNAGDQGHLSSRLAGDQAGARPVAI
jgi:hypothetical protein